MLDLSSEKSGSHRVIIDDRMYEVDLELLKVLSKKLEAVAKPERVKVRIFKGRNWSKEEIALLGTDKDETVAKKVGISTSAVAAKRRELNVAPFRSPGNPSQRKWTEEELALLGKESDSEIAHKLNISITSVGNKRRSLGIGRYTKPEREWTQEELALLGTIPDKNIAKQLGLPNHVVYFKRKSLKITAFNRIPWDEELPRDMPRLNSLERQLAEEMYEIYDKSKTLVKAVAKLKTFVKRKDPEKIKRVGSYLIVKHSDNFPLERCLTLVGIF